MPTEPKLLKTNCAMVPLPIKGVPGSATWEILIVPFPLFISILGVVGSNFLSITFTAVNCAGSNKIIASAPVIEALVSNFKSTLKSSPTKTKGEGSAKDKVAEALPVGVGVVDGEVEGFGLTDATGVAIGVAEGEGETTGVGTGVVEGVGLAAKILIEPSVAIVLIVCAEISVIKTSCKSNAEDPKPTVVKFIVAKTLSPEGPFVVPKENAPAVAIPLVLSMLDKGPTVLPVDANQSEFVIDEIFITCGSKFKVN